MDVKELAVLQAIKGVRQAKYKGGEGSAALKVRAGTDWWQKEVNSRIHPEAKQWLRRLAAMSNRSLSDTVRMFQRIDKQFVELICVENGYPPTWENFLVFYEAYFKFMSEELERRGMRRNTVH